MTEHPALAELLARVGELRQAIRRALPPVPVAMAVSAHVQPIDDSQRAAALRAILRLRRTRDLYCDRDLFGDPVWDILLDLAAARLEERAVSVSSACVAGYASHTTGLRLLGILVDRDMIVRTPDPTDGRRVFVSITDTAFTAMLAWLDRARGAFAEIASLSAADAIGDAPEAPIGEDGPC